MAKMDMQKMMQQAMKMQEQLEKVQDGLKDIPVNASAGGGMVKVEGTADMRLTSVAIDPDALDPDDVEMLQDMIVAAVNTMLEAAQETQGRQMQGVTGGLNIPGL